MNDTCHVEPIQKMTTIILQALRKYLSIRLLKLLMS